MGGVHKVTMRVPYSIPRPCALHGRGAGGGRGPGAGIARGHGPASGSARGTGSRRTHRPHADVRRGRLL